MALPPTRSVFVARDSYRLRRLRDAARLLPILGGVLLMMPLLWARGSEGTDAPLFNSSALLYIFGVWLVLIALSAVLSRRLISGQEPDEPIGHAEMPAAEKLAGKTLRHLQGSGVQADASNLSATKAGQGPDA